jgi:hypothetical protein
MLLSAQIAITGGKNSRRISSCLYDLKAVGPWPADRLRLHSRPVLLSAEGIRLRNADEWVGGQDLGQLAFNRTFRLMRNFRQALSIHLARSFLIESAKRAVVGQCRHNNQ